MERWLSSIHFEEYTSHFLDAGYDLPTISRVTPEDLIAIGITNPLHRKQIKHEISSLSVSDGIPVCVPESLTEWLSLLRLEEYEDMLCAQGYDTVDRVAGLMWEDFEEIGIRKLGQLPDPALTHLMHDTLIVCRPPEATRARHQTLLHFRQTSYSRPVFQSVVAVLVLIVWH